MALFLVVQGGFLGAFFFQALGVFETQLGGWPRYLVRRHDAVTGRQFELLGRSPGQALELVQVEGFDLFARPVGFFQELDGGIDARIVVEAIDIQVGKQQLEAVVIDDFNEQVLQAEPVQRVVLLIDLVVHAVACSG